MNENAEATALSDKEARKWAMLCHLSALVGLLGNGIGFFIGPLVVWLIKREDDPLIEEQAPEIDRARRGLLAEQCVPIDLMPLEKRVVVVVSEERVMRGLEALERTACDLELLRTTPVRDVPLDEHRVDTQRVDALDRVLVHELPVGNVGVPLADERETGSLGARLVVLPHPPAEPRLPEVQIVQRRERGNGILPGCRQRLE